MSQEVTSLVADIRAKVEAEISSAESEVKSIWVDGAKYWHALWSVRLALLSVVLGLVSQALPYLQTTLPAFPFAVLSSLSGLGAVLARLVKQPGFASLVESGKQSALEAAIKNATLNALQQVIVDAVKPGNTVTSVLENGVQTELAAVTQAVGDVVTDTPQPGQVTSSAPVVNQVLQ